MTKIVTILFPNLIVKNTAKKSENINTNTKLTAKSEALAVSLPPS